MPDEIQNTENLNEQILDNSLRPTKTDRTMKLERPNPWPDPPDGPEKPQSPQSHPKTEQPTKGGAES